MKGSKPPLRNDSLTPASYDPNLLCGLERLETRKNSNLHIDDLTFYGMDSWTAYELSWLNRQGIPRNGILYISYPCSTKNFIESKSLKLYLNSLNNERIGEKKEIQHLISNDIKKCLFEEVNIEVVHEPRDFLLHSLVIDNLEIKGEMNLNTPNSLLLQTSNEVVEESLTCTTFRSLCPLSQQPDWASIHISYEGNQLDHKSLFLYLMSFRTYQAFHEVCVERIFSDLLKRCDFPKLTVQANYLRRGGIEINPLRSTHKDFDRMVCRDKRQ